MARALEDLPSVEASREISALLVDLLAKPTGNTDVYDLPEVDAKTLASWSEGGERFKDRSLDDLRKPCGPAWPNGGK